MRDPLEGLNPDGTIRTGACRKRVPRAFEPVISAVIESFEIAADESSALLLYGSVATGRARVGTSDVDLVAFGPSQEWCEETSRALTTEFSHLSRGVAIGPTTRRDFLGDSDGAFGNRVFLRHCCTTLAGIDITDSWGPFQGDERAARGFNGDIGTRLSLWRRHPTHAAAVARKTLFAIAGIVSILDRTWTTDRDTAARRWSEIEPDYADDARMLLQWSDGDRPATAEELEHALSSSGVVSVAVDRFTTTIGLWR